MAGIFSSGPDCLAVRKGGVEPGAGDSPVPLDGHGSDAQTCSGVLDREPGEITELDQLCLERILPGECVKRPVQVDQVVESVGAGKRDRFQWKPLFSPPCFGRRLRRALSTRIRRIASAAAEKKCPRLFQFRAHSPSSNRR